MVKGNLGLGEGSGVEGPPLLIGLVWSRHLGSEIGKRKEEVEETSAET